MNYLKILESDVLPSSYNRMIQIISANSTEIESASRLFLKSQSQFMDNMLTTSHLTPIRNMRQILAQIEQIRQALGETYYKIEKKKLRIEENLNNLRLIESGGSDSSEFKIRKIKLEIGELEFQIESTMRYVESAIRKYTNYVIQYNSIADKYNLHSFTELDFENEEERYHISKAFQQALNACRSRGCVDEGNQIYFEQIGINGSHANHEIKSYLSREQQLISSGIMPTHEMQVEFILDMTEKFKGCSRRYAEWKGQTGGPTQESIDLGGGVK